MEKTFRNEKISDHIYRIIDCTSVACYLVIGDSKAALIDTGNGLGNLREYTQSLTDKKIIVILTHGHLDHMGGAGLFDEVHMSHLDLPVFKKHSDIGFRVSDTNKQCKSDLAEEDFVPVYKGEIIDIEDHEVFDLGGIHVEMISVPGHTPGMMCALIKEEKTIIFGDACGEAVLLFDEYSSSVKKYRESLISLKRYESQYYVILRNHGNFSSSKKILDNLIECCDLVLNKKDAHIPVRIHDADLYMCKMVDPKTMRSSDGKEGNLFYSSDKQ